MDQLVHLQVVEPARGRDHNVHAALNLGDLAVPVPPAVDADAERRTGSEPRRWTFTSVGSQRRWAPPCVVQEAVFLALGFDLQRQLSGRRQHQHGRPVPLRSGSTEKPGARIVVSADTAREAPALTQVGRPCG